MGNGPVGSCRFFSSCAVWVDFWIRNRSRMLTPFSNSWFDADTIILNPKVPWTTFLPPTKFPNVHFIGSKNWDGFNSGVFFLRVHEWSVKMLADAQAIPSLRPEIPIMWTDQSAMLESFSRPQFRESVVYQPLHWFNELQLQKVEQTMVKDKPNVHPGDMLIHFAGMMKDKREFMGPWLDEVENMADRWAVPLENTTYLRDVKEYWYTYGRAREALDRANNTLSLELTQLSHITLRQPVAKAVENLQNMVWNSADDIDGMQSHTEFLADTLQTAISQLSAAEDQLKAEKVKAASSKAGKLESGDSETKMSKATSFEGGVAGSTNRGKRVSHIKPLPPGESLAVS